MEQFWQALRRAGLSAIAGLSCFGDTVYLSRCRATLWSMVEHSAWLERYPDGESQHCVPLQYAHKVRIYGLIQYKWSEL